MSSAVQFRWDQQKSESRDLSERENVSGLLKIIFLLSSASHHTRRRDLGRNVPTSTTTTRPRPPEPIYFLPFLSTHSPLAFNQPFATTAIYFPSDHLCHHGSYWGNYRWEKLRDLKSMGREEFLVWYNNRTTHITGEGWEKQMKIVRKKSPIHSAGAFSFSRFFLLYRWFNLFPLLPEDCFKCQEDLSHYKEIFERFNCKNSWINLIFDFLALLVDAAELRLNCNANSTHSPEE